MKDYSLRTVKKETKCGIITPEIKDEALAYIKIKMMETSDRKIYLEANEYGDGISKGDFEEIKKLFFELGFIERGTGYGKVVVTSKFDEFIYFGGFKMQEEIFKADLEKLKYELNELSSHSDSSLKTKICNTLELLANFTTVISAIND